MQFHDTVYGDVKNGVLVLSGYIANVTVEHEMLLVRDGIKGGVIERRFGRAHCPISRLISTQADGYISFDAIRWLHGTGASLAHLNYDGTPLVVSVPRHAVHAALRRRQAALSVETGFGASIAGSLLRSKLALQIKLLEELGFSRHAAEATSHAERLTQKFRLPDALGVEGIVSVLYWKALADIPLGFGRRQHVPEYWKSFGARRSTLTGDPRGAVTPGNAMLNYLYGVLASEITIALHAFGFDPALGIMHADKNDRASLAYDLIQPARGVLDRWFLHWVKSTTLSKRDFIEGASGAIRITRPLSSHLAMTAGLWRGLAEQLAQWFYQCLSTELVPVLKLAFVDIETDAKRRAARWSVGNALQRPVPTTCAECGKALPLRRSKFCSEECATSYYNDTRFSTIVAAAASRRADPKRSLAANLAIGKKASRNVAGRNTWRSRPEWSETDDEALRRWYAAVIYPALTRCKLSAIMRATGLSKQFCITIRAGRRTPHPRHVAALAKLSGEPVPKALTPSSVPSPTRLS
jgi:CRISP-associated protein Cas1